MCILEQIEDMALEPWRIATVIRIEDMTPNTKRFWLRVDELERFDFKAGQFVTLDLPIHERPNKRWRSYSIASWPDGTNVIELVIVLDKNGLGTPYLFNEVSVGSTLSFRGPQGVFTLQHPIVDDLYFICTGTGIAPFRSMVHYIRDHSVTHKKLHLIFGCRQKCDLLYYDELKQLEQEVSSFTYIPTLSREEWEGRKGYVHDIYMELCEGRPQAQFYLCGWKGMIDEAKAKLYSLGYDRKSVHIEIYG
jgi:glycine betaine catabolism B